MSEIIHVQLSTNKRTLTMELDPAQAEALVMELTDNESKTPGPASRALITSLYSIRNNRP